MKRNTRAYLHGQKIFYLKYSLSNMSVARGGGADLPEAAASLMAQERENKHSNVWAPPAHEPASRGRQHRDAQLLRPALRLSRPACPGALPALRVPSGGALQNSLPPTDRRSQCDNSFSRTISGEKEDRKEGQGDQGPSPSQPGWSSPRECTSTLTPFSGSAGRKESSEETPG